jgi:hypothetical protein
MLDRVMVVSLPAMVMMVYSVHCNGMRGRKRREENGGRALD